MKKREFVRLLNGAKKYGTKAAAVAVAATLAFTSVPVETLASEPAATVQSEEGQNTASAFDEVQDAVDDAADAVDDAQSVVTDTTTDGYLEDTAEDLENAADALEDAENLQQGAADDMSAIEAANQAFAEALEAAKQEVDAAQKAADDAEAAKDTAVSTDSESEAREAADEAGKSADEAQDAVDAAQSKVDDAQAEYDKAYAAYQDALKKSQDASNALNEAGSELDDAVEDIDDAREAAEDYKDAADAALADVNKEGMTLIVAQHDKVEEIFATEGKTENYWAATRTLNNMIVEYYLLAANADVDKDSIRFGAEYDATEFKVITDYEKDEAGAYKVDENGNYIPVYTQITYTDNTKDDTGELDWIKANSNKDNRTVCVYEEQVRDEHGALVYDGDNKPVMRTVVKYYNYKWNDDGSIYIVEKNWDSADDGVIIAEVPAVNAVDPTYGYVDSNNNELTRDENDAKQVVKTVDGTEVVAIPDENDLRGTTSTLPGDTTVTNGSTTTTTTYTKGEENTTYAFGDTQVVNTTGTGAASVTDYNKDTNGSKDDMKREVSSLLNQYDVNAGYTIKIHYETFFQDKDYTIDNYNSSMSFWTQLDDWFADFFGTASYTIEVVHTEDTVEGIIGTTTADYTVTTTETTTDSKSTSGKGYDTQMERDAAVEAKKTEVVGQYQNQLGTGSTVVANSNGTYTITSADGTKSVTLKFSTDKSWGVISGYKYKLNYTVATSVTTTTTENKTIATQAYGAQYYNYVQTSAGTAAVPGKDAAYGTKIVWSEDLNKKLVDENSAEYQNALAAQEARIKEYTDAANAAADALEKVEEAQEKVDEAQRAYDALTSDGDASWLALKAYEFLLKTAQEKLETAKQEAEALQTVADDAWDAYEEALASLDRFNVEDDDDENESGTGNNSNTGNNAGAENDTATGNNAGTGNGVAAGTDAGTANGAAAGTDSYTGDVIAAGNETVAAGNGVAAGRNAGTRTAQATAGTTNLTTIEDEEVPLAVEEEDVDAETETDAKDADATVIEDEEVPLAAEKENTQKTFWWWILLVLLILLLCTYGVAKYQKNNKNKKNKAQA